MIKKLGILLVISLFCFSGHNVFGACAIGKSSYAIQVHITFNNVYDVGGTYVIHFKKAPTAVIYPPNFLTEDSKGYPMPTVDDVIYVQPKKLSICLDGYAHGDWLVWIEVPGYTGGGEGNSKYFKYSGDWPDPQIVEFTVTGTGPRAQGGV